MYLTIVNTDLEFCTSERQRKMSLTFARQTLLESAKSNHADCTAFGGMNQRIGIAMTTPCYFQLCHCLTH